MSIRAIRWQRFAIGLAVGLVACGGGGGDTAGSGGKGGSGGSAAGSGGSASSAGAGGSTAGSGGGTSTAGTGGSSGGADDAGAPPEVDSAAGTGDDATGAPTDSADDDGAATGSDAGPVSGVGKHVLFIWGYGEHLPTPKPGDKLMALDATMKMRLESQGLTVDLEVDALSKEADAAGKALILISSSVNRTNLFDGANPRFKDAAVPAFIMKDGVIEVMGLGNGSKGGFSTDVGQSKLTIVAPGDPLAAGLTGDVTVYTKGDRLIWSVPGPAAKSIATIVGNAKEVGIFAYDKGAAMVMGTAPAKRMAFFIHRNTDYSADGLKLFDAAIAYLLTP